MDIYRFLQKKDEQVLQRYKNPIFTPLHYSHPSNIPPSPLIGYLSISARTVMVRWIIDFCKVRHGSMIYRFLRGQPFYTTDMSLLFANDLSIINARVTSYRSKEYWYLIQIKPTLGYANFLCRSRVCELLNGNWKTCSDFNLFLVL